METNGGDANAKEETNETEGRNDDVERSDDEARGHGDTEEETAREDDGIQEVTSKEDTNQEEVQVANDLLTIAWCDNGLVDGRFMQGVTDVILHSDVVVKTTLRSNGNMIAPQRERIVRRWYEDNKTDWILWVDSDVVISPESFKLLWDNKDAITRPIVTGVYFTSDTPEESLMVPWPTLFNWTPDKTKLARVHPMPHNKLIKVGAAGMGFVLMHRNAVTTILGKLGNVLLFTEVNGLKEFTGEDIYFYSLCARSGVPLYAHTGATVPHMKRFSFDVNYYKAFTASNPAKPLHSKKKKKKR